MQHLFYQIVAFLALLGASAAFISLESPPYQYKPHIINNLNDKLREQNVAQIYSEEQLRDVDPNVFLDDVFKILDKALVDLGLDPFEVYKGTVLGVDLDVWIGGYSSMARDGDASIINAPGTLDISCVANMTNLAGNISFSFSFFGIDINAGANAQIESVTFKLALRFLSSTVNHTVTITPYVDDFQISNIGTITVQVFGLGILDPFANIFADIIANLLKFLVPILLNGIVKDILQQVLDYIFGVPTFL